MAVVGHWGVPEWSVAAHAAFTENAFQDPFLSPSNLAHDGVAGITLLRDKKGRVVSQQCPSCHSSWWLWPSPG